MDTIALFYSAPFDALPGGPVALLGLLPGALLHRHPALKLAGAWAGVSFAILSQAYAVCWLLGPEALGFPFIATGPEADDAVRGLSTVCLLPQLGYLAVWALLEKRNPRLIDQEGAHLRAVMARAWCWTTRKPSPPRR